MKWLQRFKLIKGITLFELIVVIAIIGILAAVGVPSFESMIKKRELKNASENLFSILNGIRSWELQHPQSLFPGEVYDADFWVNNWKSNLTSQYLSKMNDKTPDNPLLLTLESGVRKIEYYLAPHAADFLHIYGTYSVNNNPQGFVYLTYDGILSTESVVPGTCPNGVLGPGEQCENDFHCAGVATCNTATCTCSGGGGSCGDGTVNNGEQCDDNNTISGDGCSSTCRDEVCGDGIKQDDEGCDGNPNQCPPIAGNNVVCTTACECSYSPIGNALCGDGTVTAPELCDRGNLPIIPAIGCPVGSVCAGDCKSCCGDGILTPSSSEVCDIGVGCGAITGSVCNSTCSACECPSGESENPPGSGHCCPTGTSWNGSSCSACGNNALDVGEICDESAFPNGCPFDQECNAACNACSCPAGTALSNYHCCPVGSVWNGHDCTTCGDGVKSGWEQCDPTDPDAADQTCTPYTPSGLPGCGMMGKSERYSLQSGSVEEILSEQMSYYNLSKSGPAPMADPCPPGSPQPRYCQECLCVPGSGGICGNNLLETGEQCDDGNTTSGDGCSASCQQEYCGDSVIQPGLNEQCDNSACAPNPNPPPLGTPLFCMNCQCQCVPFLCSQGSVPNMETCSCDPMPCDSTSDCDDQNECTDDSCDLTAGHCVFDGTGMNGLACDDGDICTTGEQCDAGICIGGTATSCDDGNPCTTDVCDYDTGCINQNLPNGTSCADADLCDGDEVCDNFGVCQPGVSVVCTALDQCHDVGVCDPGTGVCSNPIKADGTSCVHPNSSQTWDHDGNPGTPEIPVYDNECYLQECIAGACQFTTGLYDSNECDYDGLPQSGCNYETCSAGWCIPDTPGCPGGSCVDCPNQIGSPIAACGGSLCAQSSADPLDPSLGYCCA